MTEPRVYTMAVCVHCAKPYDELSAVCECEPADYAPLELVPKADYDKLWHKFAAAMPLTDYAPPAAKSMLDKTFYELDNESTQ